MISLREHINLQFDDHSINEMAQIGIMDNKFVIVVWTNDPGNIPHFHIMDKATRGNEFHTCVKIELPEYFEHTGKEDKLNSKQRKALVDFFNSTDKWGENNWIVLLKEWERNNSNYEIGLDVKMPDYTKLK